MKKLNIIILTLVIAQVLFVGCSSQNGKSQSSGNLNDEYDVAAYVWPSCHHDKRLGDVPWPEGEGEWEIIKKGTPRFEGHYQPKIPLWGYEPDNDPKVMERWIDAATDHGVNVFIFDWYWYNDGPFLESSINDGFLKANNNEKMKFYIMWANHDMPQKLINPYKFTDYKVKWDGDADLETFKAIVDRVIKQYFSKPNYYKIDGKPVFSLFSQKDFLDGVGGLEKGAEAIDYFRNETKKAGFDGLHLQQIVFGPPGEEMVKNIETLGVDSVTMYNWGGPHPQDYIRWGEQALERRKKSDEALSVPFIPNAAIGWDNSPRFPKYTKENIVHLNKSPKAFASFLQRAKEYCDQRPGQPKLITIFAWNEWIEGSYLLPDMKYGYGYLEVVKKVVSGEYDKY